MWESRKLDEDRWDLPCSKGPTLHRGTLLQYGRSGPFDKPVEIFLSSGPIRSRAALVSDRIKPDQANRNSCRIAQSQFFHASI
jgi:hypothetical protein